MDIRNLLTVMIEYRQLWRKKENTYGRGTVFLSSVSNFFRSLMGPVDNQLPKEYMDPMEIDDVPCYHSLNDLRLVSFL